MEILEGPTFAQMAEISGELNEDSSRLDHNIALLEKWVACQNHLPQNYDRRILETFLRGCKHDLNRAKKKIEMYFLAKATVPEFYSLRNPQDNDIMNILKCVHVVVMPKLTPRGYRVVIFKLRKGNPSKFDLKAAIKLMFMLSDIRVVEETPIAGDVFIYDQTHCTPIHVAKFISPLMKKATTIAHVAYPQRMQQIHVVNAPPLADKALNLVKSFLSDKVKNRFVIHKSCRTLIDHIPEDVLPADYGGSAPRIEELARDWTHCLIKHTAWFQFDESVKAKGHRPQTCKWEDDLQGSFRQLTID